MKQFWQFLFLVLIVACAAFGGMWIGQNFLASRSDMHHHAAGDMHALFHDGLHLDKRQAEELAVIEKEFRRQKAMLEEQMKLANMELAEAIRDGGYNSSQTVAAVDKIHGAMGELQKLTLQHLADMRAVLSEEQNKKLEEEVVEQLYRNAGR